MTTKIYAPGAYGYVTNEWNNQKIIAYANALNVSKTAVVAAIVKEHESYPGKYSTNV